MKYLRVLGAVTLAGVLAVAASGCWSMSGYQLSKTKLRPGKPKVSKTDVVVRSHVTSKERERFFILTAAGVESGLSFGRGKFDIKRQFGKKPRLLVPNKTIRERIMSTGNCGNVDLETWEPLSELKVKVFATPGQFDNKGPSNKQAVSRITLRQKQLSEIGTDGAQDTGDIVSDVMIAVGSWADADDDGNIDLLELQCSGGALTQLATKFAD